MEPILHRFAVLDSTNRAAHDLARLGDPEGTVVIAERQTGGRGRGDRSWHSPAGGIYFSALLKPNPGRRVTDLAFLAGVAVAETVSRFVSEGKHVSVKWPNDCLVNRRKIAGVLGEAVGDMRVVGIGLNVNTAVEELAPFASSPFPATSLFFENGHNIVDFEAVLETLLHALFSWHGRYRLQGFVPVQQRWERHCDFIGKKVTLSTDPAPITATCLGIDEDGALVLSTESGERRHVHAGELTCYWP